MLHLSLVLLTTMSGDRAELHKESKEYAELLEKAGGLDLTLPLEEIRSHIEENAQDFRDDFVFNGTKENFDVPGGTSSPSIPVTIVRPSDGKGVCSQIIAYFHGGGFVWGSRNTVMSFCELLSEHCNCVVVNVEYRLAPENKFPACYEDAEQVVRWCFDNKQYLAKNDKAKVGVAGDSAGGNISTSVCHLVPGLDYQILIYPHLDFAADRKYESERIYGTGYPFTNEQMEWFANHFLNGDAERSNKKASPMLHDSSVGLPPALIVEAECDLLAGHSSDYHKKLTEWGIKSELLTLEGTIHGFAVRPGAFKEINKITLDKIAQFISDVCDQN